MMFAIITPALITGAFTNRVTFKAYLLFLVVWLLFVYFPFVHMVWGGGLLASGACSTSPAGSSSTPSPASRRSPRSSTSASGSSSTRRTASRSSRSAPACSGSAGTASTPAASCGSTPSPSLAFLNTDLAASFAAVTWLFVEWRARAKPHFVGLLTGAVAGLATITPAAGYVPIYASVVIGIAAGLVCYYAVPLKNRLKWDDALDVWGVHGVGGLLGIVLLGVFASTALEPGRRRGPAPRHPRSSASRSPPARLLALRLRLHLRDAAA